MYQIISPFYKQGKRGFQATASLMAGPQVLVSISVIFPISQTAYLYAEREKKREREREERKQIFF